ncbi:MAG TPA: PEGA domain-containing protein [Oligoflexia bacterium]|nr:PEGA domain-containing protein [Oligoflexia bacterium]HMR25521.1 PEGA domain-containing protein [Oligoflexia bacterium]
MKKKIKKITVKTSLVIAVALCFLQLVTAYGQSYRNIYVGALHIVDDGDRRFSREDLNRELLTSVENEKFFRMVSLSKVNSFKSNFVDESTEETINNQDLQRATKLLTVGKRMYHELNFSKARDSLSLSKKLFIENLQYLRSNKDLLEAHLYLGMTWLAIQKEKDAYNEFKKVAYLDPNFEMNATQYSPAVIPVFETARSEVKAKTISEVTVTASQDNMNVYVNGRLMGKTPVSMKLYAGDYFFLVEKPGFEPWYKLEKIRRASQTVEGQNKVNVDEKQWSRMFRTREGDEQNSEDTKMLIEEAKKQGADYILLSSLEKNINYRLMGQLYNINKKTFSQVVMFNVEKGLGDYPGAVDEMVGTLKNMILGTKPNLQLNVADYGPAPEANKNIGPNKKWYKQWWVYPVAAGILVGSIFAAQELGGGSGGTIVINNN